jgi:2-polyprenyl-3-methyl-5-hydroxy-6-metoxy-1,4-benzoquinol methylase
VRHVTERGLWAKMNKTIALIGGGNAIPADFDDALYLRIHPDVRAAGIDARLHYLKYGRREGRPYLPERRRDKLLSFIDPAKRGIEIGPSHSPICPKSEGYRVEIIDHLSQEALKQKYTGHGVNLDAIEHVDYVWNGEAYSDLTNCSHGYGWIVASHVIEHTPDLVQFLRGCDDILDEKGVLVLAIPDKRYCFDHLRPKTSLAAVIDAFEAKRSIHSVGTAAENFLNACQIDPTAEWDSARATDLRIIHPLSDVFTSMQAIRNSHFLDLHAWCFTPSSFRLMIHDLFTLQLINSREVGFFDTVGNEFIIAMSRSGTGPDISRLDLAVKSLKE